MKCFDLHHHVGSLGLGNAAATSTGGLEADMTKRLAVMDRFEIDAAAVLPSLQFDRPRGIADTLAANNAAAAYRDANPTRFPAAIGTVDPLNGSEACAREISRVIHDLGMSGVTWHHRFQGLFLSDPRMEPLLEQTNDLGVPVFIHVFAESAMAPPWALEKWARRFPDQVFVALDALTSFTQSKTLLDVGRRCPNILFETAGTFPLGRIIQEFVAELGAHRVVFGSDLYVDPMTWDTPGPLFEIRLTDSLSEEEKQDVLVRNARRLLRLP